MAPPGLAHGVEAGLVGLLVRHVDGHAGDVLGAASRGAHHGEDVREGAIPLLAEIVRLELLVFVPAHLAAHEEDAPLGQDSIRVALRRLPTLRLDGPKQTHAITSPPSTPRS